MKIESCRRNIPPASWMAFGLSAAVHIGVMVGFGPFVVSAPRPGMFEPIDVALLAEPASKPALKSTIDPGLASIAEAQEIPRAMESSPDRIDADAASTPENSQTVDNEPLVESRYDVAALNNPKPLYPLVARRNGAQGRVVLSVQVSASGASSEVLLKHSSGHAVLDDAALQTVRRWHFIPARRGDTPVESWVDVPITFRLES
jgi:protein TonB